MQTYRNDKYIRSRARIGRYASFAGMGVLLVGLIITWTSPELIGVSLLALIAGFVLSQVGLYYANRFARAERPDQVLPKALKGFDDRYMLFQYTSPAGNVLVTPSSCVVFALKMQGGPIQYQNGRWKNNIGWRRILAWFAQDSLGNPTREAESEADALRRYVAKKIPDIEVPVQPVIVFANPAAEVDAGESPVPAIHYKKLKEWLRGPGKSGNLNTGARAQLLELLVSSGSKEEPAPDDTPDDQ